MLRLDKLDAIEVVPPNANGENDDDVPKKVVRRKKWTRKPGEALNLSTKMAYLHAELLRFSKHNRNSANYDPWSIEEREGETIELDEDGLPIPVKSIVFSQWTTMLDRIEDMLQEINIGYCRLDGTMTREQRAEAMDALRNKKTVEVMLVSTRAGGVGLNLTAASRCYLVDPYWNPSVEAQAIDRIHRMGQKREVTAIKLMLNDTVENKLERIQHKKSELAKMSLKNMSRKELMETKAEELASLFN
jgi:SNF2 family DNA or RNA helicase